jgi:hypothetical protein
MQSRQQTRRRYAIRRESGRRPPSRDQRAAACPVVVASALQVPVGHDPRASSTVARDQTARLRTRQRAVPNHGRECCRLGVRAGFEQAAHRQPDSFRDAGELIYPPCLGLSGSTGLSPTCRSRRPVLNRVLFLPPASAMRAAAKAALLRRRSVLEHALANDGGIEFHQIGPVKP